MSVHDQFLVGKLALRRPDDEQVALVEPASMADENGDLDEINTTNNQSLVPFSMGLTFCMPLPTEC